MVKIKRLRTIDAVVAGWRPGKEENTVGSLMLGLYDPEGELHVVGHTSGLKAKQKRELVETLAPYETGDRGLRRPQPLVGRSRPRMGRAAARAGDRGQLRPRQRGAHPPRREDPALARGQAAAATACWSSSTVDRLSVRRRYITYRPDVRPVGKPERPRHGADDLEAERAPERHGREVALHHGVELHRHEALGGRPFDYALAESPADAAPGRGPRRP